MALAIALPGLLASLWIIGRTYASETATLEQGLRDTTRALSLVIERELARRETIARMLSESPYLDAAPNLAPADLANFYAQAQRATQGIDGWIVLSTPDQQLINSRRPLGEPLPQRVPGQPPLYPFATDKPLLSGLATGRINGELAASMQVPVIRNGSAPLNVGLTVRPAEMQRLIDEQKLPAGWNAAIIDSTGLIVARRPDPQRWVGLPSSNNLQSRMKASASGFFESVTLEGVPSMAFFSKSTIYGWAFVISVPRAAYGNNLRRSLGETAAGALLLILAAIGGAVFVARRISRPIYRLRDQARRVEAGEVVEAEKTGLAEADTVSAALAQASQAIARSRIELEEKVTAATNLTRDAQKQLSQSQRLEALGQLTGGVAHDVNNLLAVIDNSAYVLERRPPGSDNSAQWAAIARAIDVGRRLTGHLLRFARWNVVRPEVINLATFLPSLSEILKTALGSMIKVSMRVEPSTRTIQADPSELELALINLAVNSRDAMPDGGEFIVVARNATDEEAKGLAPGQYVVIAVSDTGSGIAPEIRDRVFDPFFTTKGLGQGTGLGLSQIHGFCTQAGGTARILASSPAGTTILLLLPVSGAEPSAAEPSDNAPEGAEVPQNRELLLVEDNAELGQATETLLTLFGYAVTRASSAEEAIELIDAGDKRFDLVLSDVVMPGGMNGISFARYLQANVPGLPIILITGYAARIQDAHGFEVLRKPCAPEMLLAALRRVERNAASGKAAE
ncbi:response regulator [Piscinibacter koreensis]|uniref:histidine kinase n=1 Tax=Piscinibacter koreensis TaxID=2742824 RepID=A0A7Y6NLX2_9BURK|nr:response regulator [Schlegelella koreensis]NUZ05529.1 response regulator [Schlegelella koreensis]